MHRGLQLGRHFGVGGVGQVRAGGDQHAAGHLVVFGLADQVGGHMRRIGGVVGEDGDLGRPGLGVDADQRAADPLGGGDVDVARPGDHVDRRQLRAIGVGAAVGQQRHRLRAADRPHLVDAQQPGRGQDRRMRQAVEAGLRRAGHHQRVDTGGLRGHHVHHHAGRVDRIAAGHVEADPLDGDPPLGDRRARAERGGDVGAALVGVHGAGALDRHLQRVAHVGVQSGQRGLQRGGGHAHGRGAHAVERLAEFQRRLGPALGDGLHDRPDLRQHRLHVGATARQGGPQPGSRQLRAPQVDAGHHRVR